ncbi:MAG TPA: aspartyl/asparaginyl beta-hydroxylase domain-containing protein [Steroidobacteraceae bacterium]|nr:aspartyl/asparaginyl beta-hydroxylase domain-containing protein [Steroidobacteraceae bacterium]
MNTPADAVAHFNRGRSCEMAADYASARDAYAEAVRLDPGLFAARLQLAVVLERLRQPELALVQYKRALSDAQRQGHWLNEATTPPLMRTLIQHAVRTVRAGHHALFDRLFAPLRERYGRDSLARIEQGIRIYLNEEPAVYPDPRQKPSLLYIPGLPTRAYFDCTSMPWVEQLEARTPQIVAELQLLLQTDAGRERVFPTDELEEQNLRASLESPPTWNGYYFYRWGARREDNCARCPDTARALDALPLCRIRQHGPEVLFSVFTAGTHLLPHRGVTNTRSVGHLALIVPPDCRLRVGGEVYEWRPGKVVVFDDTYEHEAWNNSSSMRVVLIFDLWNPFMTEAERAACADLVAALGDLRSAAETG